MDLNIIFPKGSMGASEYDDLLDTVLRVIAEKASIDPDGEWASKYGTQFENDVFMMHPFCWCEKPDCPWCLACICETAEECEQKCSNKEYAPNFHYKPLDFKVWWYKYIGRGMKTNKTLTAEQLKEMLEHCLRSIRPRVKVIVAGSRSFNDYTLLEKELTEFLGDMTPDEYEIVSGTARGADSLGEKFAREKGCRLTRMPADWDRYGRSAGYRRNEQMAKYADMCICFWDGQSRGTKHMIDLAKKYGLRLKVVKFQ